MIGSKEISASDVDKAVSAINNAFDQCRVLVGFSHTDPRLDIIPTPVPSVSVTETSAVPTEVITPETVFATVTVYPNPFKTMTNFSINVKMNCHVKLEIFNQAGSLIKVLLNEDLLSEDLRVVTFDASLAPYTMFHYRLTTNLKTISGTIMKIK